MAGIGVVIRNEQGLVIASMSKKFILPHSIDEVGVLVAIKAMDFAQDIGISSIILEGDSKVIIKALVSDEMNLLLLMFIWLRRKNLNCVLASLAL